MKYFATAAVILVFGVTVIYANEGAANQAPVRMPFSGTAVPTPANLQAGSSSGEDDFAGNGTLGQFTFRDLEAESSTPQSSSTCSGPNNLYFVRTAGAGVFRFEDGSLLTVTLKQGSDCIDLAAQQANCLVIFQITGGTGRFNKASGIITMTEQVRPVLVDASGNPVFFAATGNFTGMISGVTNDDKHGDER